MRIRLNLEELSEDEHKSIYYISALSSSEIRLIKDKVIQLELFSKDLVEIKKMPEHDMFLCNNLCLERRKTKQEALKSRFEQEIRSVKNHGTNVEIKIQTILKKKKQGHKTKNQ